MRADIALEDPTPSRITEADLIKELMQRYDKRVVNGSWSDARYIRAAHVPNGLSWKRTRIADFVAMDTQSHSRGDHWDIPNREWQQAPVFHGHEIKVSRSDWLAELRDPSKAESFKRYMHFWWLVVSDKSIVRDDLPEGWGLMVLGKSGLRVSRRAPLLRPDAMPNDLVGGIVRASLKTERGVQQ